jgi:hypothetical protein
MKQKSKIDKAAEQLLNVFEQHLATLPPAEQDSKWAAIHKAAVRIDNRAKSEDKPKSAGSPRAGRIGRT